MFLLSLLLLVVWFFLASLPFLGCQLFMGLPVFKKPKPNRFRVLEFILSYGLFVLIGTAFERSTSQVAVQGWAFYATTLLLFLVAASPAFMWRYLWKKPL